MKFIFSFLFGILILSPTFASYECSEDTSSDECKCAGWGYDSWGCSQCTNTQYSPANDSVCHDCIDDSGNWTAGAQPVPNSIFDTDHATYGQSSCPWVCIDGYFKSITNTSNNQAECLSCPDTSQPVSYGPQDITNIGDCSCPTDTYLIKTIESDGAKYYCGTCGVGTPSNTGNIKTCTCPATSNRVHGNQEYKTISNTLVECACPSGANWDSNRCKCSANKYLSQGTDGAYSCESCPEHSTSDVGSTNVNDCRCDSDFPKRNLDENNNLIGCSACADNAIFHNGSCQCNSGYYGDGASSCTQCPIGTTTTIGATQRSDCKMNHNTKFCYGSGDNKKCMHLIPAGTVISVSNNT